MKIPKITKEVRKYIGKKVCWERSHDRYRGCFISYGIIKSVHNRNVEFENGDWKHFDELINLETTEDLFLHDPRCNVLKDTPEVCDCIYGKGI